MRAFASFLVTALMGALLATGCAKKELVKEEPAPAAPAQQAEPAPAPAPAAPREQVVQPQPVEESKVPEAKAEETPAQAAQATSLETIYFDYDSFGLSDQARDILARNAEIIKTRKMKIQLEGHTDERGSDEYNLALGEKRAAAAKRYLATMGVPSANLSVITYGEEKPAVPGSDESAWAKNRRVEFVGR